MTNAPARKAPGFLLRLHRRIERAVLRLFVSRRLFNPWFPTQDGITFIIDLVRRNLHGPHFSRATRKATFRFLITQPLLYIPFKRWQFKRRHGFYPPAFIAISPTRRCNLACPGCFEGGHATEELSFETVDRIVREARAMGVCFFILIGGEPLCWPHLLKLLAQHPTAMFGIYTNGTLVTPALAAQLARCGNVQLGFSIEGFEAQTDARRGPGVFRAVLQAMQACRAAGINFSYSVTVTRANSEEVVTDAFVDFMLAQGCVTGWYYQYMPVGCTPDTALLPTAAQRMRRRERIAELCHTREIGLCDFVNAGTLMDGCICAGRVYLHVNAAGGVEPCAFYPFAADSILERSLIEVLHSPFFTTIRRQQAATKNLLAQCPIVDNPAWLRHAVTTGGARPTQATAAPMLDEANPLLDAHAAAWRALADPAWQAEHAGRG
ncbi:MAG: radical SAM protein [bacterium]|nr:radical SAM protein [bacterium]